jgi:hypothetical protein
MIHHQNLPLFLENYPMHLFLHQKMLWLLILFQRLTMQFRLLLYLLLQQHLFPLDQQ